jgi:hypothetical protein
MPIGIDLAAGGLLDKGPPGLHPRLRQQSLGGGDAPSPVPPDPTGRPEVSLPAPSIANGGDRVRRLVRFLGPSVLALMLAS